MMENPNKDQLDQMIEAIFVSCDKLLVANALDYPGNVTGFTELVRLTFDADETGRAIFASMDDELFETLFALYDERRIKTAKQGSDNELSP